MPDSRIMPLEEKTEKITTAKAMRNNAPLARLKHPAVKVNAFFGRDNFVNEHSLNRARNKNKTLIITANPSEAMQITGNKDTTVIGLDGILEMTDAQIDHIINVNPSDIIFYQSGKPQPSIFDKLNQNDLSPIANQADMLDQRIRIRNNNISIPIRVMYNERPITKQKAKDHAVATIRENAVTLKSLKKNMDVTLNLHVNNFYESLKPKLFNYPTILDIKRKFNRLAKHLAEKPDLNLSPKDIIPKDIMKDIKPIIDTNAEDINPKVPPKIISIGKTKPFTNLPVLHGRVSFGKGELNALGRFGNVQKDPPKTTHFKRVHFNFVTNPRTLFEFVTSEYGDLKINFKPTIIDEGKTLTAKTRFKGATKILTITNENGINQEDKSVFKGWLEKIVEQNPPFGKKENILKKLHTRPLDKRLKYNIKTHKKNITIKNNKFHAMGSVLFKDKAYDIHAVADTEKDATTAYYQKAILAIAKDHPKIFKELNIGLPKAARQQRTDLEEEIQSLKALKQDMEKEKGTAWQKLAKHLMQNPTIPAERIQDVLSISHGKQISNDRIKIDGKKRWINRYGGIKLGVRMPKNSILSVLNTKNFISIPYKGTTTEIQEYAAPLFVDRAIKGLKRELHKVKKITQLGDTLSHNEAAISL